jgi:4-hydroxybenzoate polyprenyltransferase
MFLLRWLAYSNCWIALAAVSILQTGYLLQGMDVRWDLLTLLTGTATWGVYLLIRVVAKSRIDQYKRDERWSFFLTNYRFMTAGAIFFLAVTLVLFFLVPVNVRWALVIPGMIALLYGLPLVSGNKRLRDIGQLKIFLIAAVWAFTGSILPSVAGAKVPDILTFVLFCAQFLFIFGITLPFDIKDLESDRMNNVVTLPVLMGKTNTYTLAFLSLFMSGALLQYAMFLDGRPELGAPVGVSLMIAGILVHMSGRVKGNLVYFFGIDGSIILQFLLVWSYIEFV